MAVKTWPHCLSSTDCCFTNLSLSIQMYNKNRQIYIYKIWCKNVLVISIVLYIYFVRTGMSDIVQVRPFCNWTLTDQSLFVFNWTSVKWRALNGRKKEDEKKNATLLDYTNLKKMNLRSQLLGAADRRSSARLLTIPIMSIFFGSRPVH